MTNVIPVDFSPVIPPSDTLAEREILGLMLVNPAVCPDVFERLTVKDFHRPLHQDIFLGMLALSRRGDPSDLPLLRAELKAQSSWERVGSTELGKLFNIAGTSQQIGQYISLVAACSERRRLIRAAEHIELAARDDCLTLDEVRTKAEGALTQAVGAGETDGLSDQRSGMDALWSLMEKADASETGLTDVRCGIDALDEHTGGLEAPWLVTILAEPGCGKSSLALGYALTTAQLGGRVLVYSLEMIESQVSGRLCSALSGVPYGIIRRGLSRMSDRDRAKFLGASEAVLGLPIHVDDSSHLTPEMIKARSLRYVRKHGPVALVVIDYLNLMSGGAPDRASQAEQFDGRAKAAAQLGKELVCPVILCAQVDKEAQKRRGPVRKADLKGSSGPVDASDLILLPYRPKIHNDSADSSLAQIDIGKFRHSPTAMIGEDQVRWNGARMQFGNAR